MNLRNKLKRNKSLVRVVYSYRKFIQKYTQKYKGINWIKTFYLNFKTQKIKDAIKLPILVYGRLKILSLCGIIKIENDIRHGMIRLGLNTDCFSASKGSALLNVSGTLIFKGRFIASVDYTIDALGVLSFGNFCALGNGVKVRCFNKITIGKSLRCGVESQIFDTNFHFTRNIETGEIYYPHGEIIIGDFCWIGNRSTIMKGTHLPDYSVIGGNSLLNKNYTQNNTVCPMIAGMPAKIIKTGIARVFSAKEESKLYDIFKNNPDVDFYQGETGITDETEAINIDFNNF
jgi:acetyltransferase-like isoleucine patch superfamily enzyme